MNELYGNQLNKMLTEPGGFQGTPGFKFALDSGLEAVGRSNSRMRGSGNALAALTKYGTGLAQQDYGSQMDRLGRLNGQEQQYDLGQTRNANDFQLGQAQNATTNQRDFWNYDLGRESNANASARDINMFGRSSGGSSGGYGGYGMTPNWNMGIQNTY